MSRELKSNWLLVDGNNVIHAWPDLLKLHHQRRGLAHIELCRRLRHYSDVSGIRIAVVFDGRGSRIEEEREKGGIQIFYTDGGTSADDVIERLAQRYARKNRIIVATDDFAIQNLVSAAGAEVMSAKSLNDTLGVSESRWRDWLQ